MRIEAFNHDHQFRLSKDTAPNSFQKAGDLGPTHWLRLPQGLIFRLKRNDFDYDVNAKA